MDCLICESHLFPNSFIRFECFGSSNLSWVRRNAGNNQIGMPSVKNGMPVFFILRSFVSLLLMRFQVLLFLFQPFFFPLIVVSSFSFKIVVCHDLFKV